MADHGFRLRPGAYQHVRDYLSESSDAEMARRIGVSASTIANAKRASGGDTPAPMLFVAAAQRATGWPLDSVVTIAAHFTHSAA